MRRGGGARACCAARFNPRPPSPRGDALFRVEQMVPLFVSIHAPRHRGAMPRRPTGCSRRHRRFNPRPPSPRGDASTSHRGARPLISFNPRPPSPRGDAPMPVRQRWCLDRFNPRPPSPRGDAGLCAARDACGYRFNPRPPSPRGDAFDLRREVSLRPGVSIHAPRHRGAMPRAQVSAGTTSTSFNPRPPSPRGDAGDDAGAGERFAVSIHAPRHRGAMPVSRC